MLEIRDQEFGACSNQHRADWHRHSNRTDHDLNSCHAHYPSSQPITYRWLLQSIADQYATLFINGIHHCFPGPGPPYWELKRTLIRQRGLRIASAVVMPAGYPHDGFASLHIHHVFDPSLEFLTLPHFKDATISMDFGVAE